MMANRSKTANEILQEKGKLKRFKEIDTCAFARKDVDLASGVQNWMIEHDVQVDSLLNKILPCRAEECFVCKSQEVRVLTKAGKAPSLSKAKGGEKYLFEVGYLENERVSIYYNRKRKTVYVIKTKARPVGVGRGRPAVWKAFALIPGDAETLDVTDETYESSWTQMAITLAKPSEFTVMDPLATMLKDEIAKLELSPSEGEDALEQLGLTYEQVRALKTMGFAFIEGTDDQLVWGTLPESNNVALSSLANSLLSCLHRASNLPEGEEEKWTAEVIQCLSRRCVLIDTHKLLDKKEEIDEVK